MTVAIVDFGGGNLRSCQRAFERMSGETTGEPVIVTADPEAVRRADRIVLPGQGAFADVHDGLMAVPGLFDAIAARVAEGAPYFGICVGMQLMATVGREHRDTPGFDWIPGEVVRLTPADPGLKIPHMGWNELHVDVAHPVLQGITTRDHAYFVHSYHFVPERAEHLLVEVDYGGRVAAIVGRDNLFGTQFHPEKSQATGLRLIANFLRWAP